MVLPFVRENEIVLVKQYKHALGEVLIELPAGFQQQGKFWQKIWNSIQSRTWSELQASN